MGVLGRKIGELVGGGLGRIAGKALDFKKRGAGAQQAGGDIGSTLGGLAGDLIPFKKGGRVRKTGKALLHKGEFVLPKGVPATKTQVKKVRKRGGRV